MWSEPPGAFPQVPAPPPPSVELGGQLHPAAVAVWTAPQVGALVVLFLVNPMSLIAMIPFVVVVVAVSGVRYSRFRWQLTDQTLVIEQGLINRQRRLIPLERVQSVDLVRRVTHRLFRVVALHVEAIGGGDTEGRLDALSLRQAEHLREVILRSRAQLRGGQAAPAPPTEGDVGDAGELLARVPRRRLVVAGATEANATLIAAVAGLGWQLAGDRIDELAERLPALLGTRAVLVVTIVIVLAVIVLLVLAQLLAHWDFELRRTATELRVRRGLTEQRYDTIPLRRVQAVRIEENIPRRLLGLAAVRTDVAGKPGGGSGGTDTLLPIGAAGDARHLVEQVLALPGLTAVELQPMPRRARTRRRFRALAVVAVLTTGAAAWWGWVGLLVVALAVPALAAADAAYRALGHAQAHGMLIVRSGWWVRRTAFVPTDRLQSLALTATVFQRWRRLATLDLQIARSPGLWSGPQMIDLDAELGRGITAELSEVIHSHASPRGEVAAPPA